MALFVNCGIVAAIWFGARWVDFGDMRPGDIVAFVQYMTHILMSMNFISMIMNTFVRVRASSERIAEVMDSTETGDADDAQAVGIRVKAASPNAPHLEFRDVGFTYRGSVGEAALGGIDFALPRGETLGVIGPTGSGKSTLAWLVLRFYAPTAGEIRVDGDAANALTAAEWRERCAIVPQTPQLFTGTIRDNLLWGKSGAAEDELYAAINAAQAQDFILSAPEGLDREISQSGVNFSGGQKQRISIARALVRTPELLVLDDCTSALDAVTEANVKTALRAYAMTTILITQRIATAKSCDKILVLDNGRQAGFGTHAALMETCALYRDIYDSQIGSDAADYIAADSAAEGGGAHG
jgi:ATP-binding cassette subfamily B protein